MGTSKSTILQEIRRAAEANGGTPPGRLRFQRESGISEAECQRYWVRWNDAVREAGLEPNAMTQAYSEEELLKMLCGLIRELGHFPVNAELRMKARGGVFPSHNTFRRLGSKAELASRLLAYCKVAGGFDDVVSICSAAIGSYASGGSTEDISESLCEGYVYMALLKIGRERRYKIGKAILVGRRVDQISIQLPVDLELVHAINTDDAYGIEAYWHRRFEAKRTKGEWFVLTAGDIKAFKRRRFM